MPFYTIVIDRNILFGLLYACYIEAFVFISMPLLEECCHPRDSMLHDKMAEAIYYYTSC